MDDDIKSALRIASMPASWREKRLPQMSETVLDVPRQAAEMYPFVQRNHPNTKINIRPGMWAETYPPGEEGGPHDPRPAEFPRHETGVEVYRSDLTPADYAAEYLHADPRAHAARAEMMKSYTPEQLEWMKGGGDYKESIEQHQPEHRAMENATDALMRSYMTQGHPNNQWSQEELNEFHATPQQEETLQGLKDYTEGRAQGGSVHDYLSAEDRRLLDYIMSHDEPGFEERKSGGRINGVLDYDPDWDMHLRHGYQDGGSPAPYGVVDMGDKIILGSPHGEAINLSDDLRSRVQDIAKQHGAYYEGAAGDVEANKGLIPEYRGSWDEAHGSGVKGYPVEYLAPLFSNINVNHQPETFSDPEKSIMASIIANQDKAKYFKDRRFDEKALRDFLMQGSEGDVNFLKLAQEKATPENLKKFFSQGESLMWPDNWEEYPHNLGKIAKRFEDARNQYLLDAPPGVYVAGAGHIPELKRLRKDLKVIGGERAGYATDGSVEGDVQFAPEVHSHELPIMAQQPQLEPVQKRAPVSSEIFPVTADDEGLHLDWNAGIPGKIKHAGQYFADTLSGNKPMDVTSPEAIEAANTMGGFAMTGSMPFSRPAGSLASGLTQVEAPQLTKSQSQEAMRKAWEAGQGNTDKYKTWNHQWNMEEGPKFRAAQPEAPAVGPGTVVQKKPVGFQLPDPYERVTNPAGFYSHGAEAARGLPQQKGTLEQMLAALKGYGVKPEEIRWSGVEQAFAGRPHVTGEELAQHFEQRLPKVNRIEKAEASEFDHDLYDQYFEQEYQRLHDEDFENDFNYAMEDHDLENMTERERGRLEEQVRDQISEQYSEQASENANQLVAEHQREHGPKWGSDEYNFPGGYDYREHVLNIPHANVSGFHPDVMNPLTQEEYNRLSKAYSNAQQEASYARMQERNSIAQFHRQNAEKYAQKEIDEMKAAGHQFVTPEEAEAIRQRYFDKQDEYSKAREAYNTAWRNNDPNAHILEAKANNIHDQVRALYDEFDEARGKTEEAYFDHLLPQIQRSYREHELATLMGNRSELEALSKTQEIQAAEEAERAAQTELYDLERELKEESDKLYAYIPEYERQLYQHQTHWGDIENPILHNRFKTYTVTDPNTGEQFKVLNKSEGQSDFAKEEFMKTFTPEEEKNYLDLINKSDKTPEENLRLAQLVGRGTGKYVEAPYVGSTDRWAELSAKDALVHAIENGYDRIFITGGKEQAKRWSGNMREAAEQVLWNTAEDDGAASVVDSMREPYSAALYGKKYNDLTSSETYDLQQKMRRIIRGEEPNIFPDDIYAVPTTIKKVMFRMNNGDSARLSVKQIKTPNGGTKNIIVDSNKPGFTGQNLSAVAGQDLANQIMSEADGGIHLKDFMMGSSGYENVYDQAYPKAYKKIMKSLDPEAKVEAGTMPTKRDRTSKLTVRDIEDEFEKMSPEQKEAWGEETRSIIDYMTQHPYVHAPFENALRQYATPELRRYLEHLNMDQRQGTWVHITPKMRDEYNRLKRKYGAVFPAYKRGGVVKDSVSKIGNQMSKVRDSVMKLAQGGSAVDDALRLAKQGRFPLHQAIARTGYATDGFVEGDVKTADQPLPMMAQQDPSQNIQDALAGKRADEEQKLREVAAQPSPYKGLMDIAGWGGTYGVKKASEAAQAAPQQIKNLPQTAVNMAKDAVVAPATSAYHGTAMAMGMEPYDKEKMEKYATQTAMGMAGLGYGIGEAPANSLGMFIGRNAELNPAEQRAFAEAESRILGGHDPRAVHTDTNVHPIHGGELAYEISDQPSKFMADRFVTESRPFYENGAEIYREVPSYAHLPDVLPHDELYQKYPHLKHHGVFVNHNVPDYAGYIAPHGATPGYISIGSDIIKDPEQARKVLLHEIQHIIQHYEDWPSGGDPDNPMLHAIPIGTNSRERMESRLNDNYYEPRQAYGLTAGERQAYNVEKRADLPPEAFTSPENRAQLYPLDSEPNLFMKDRVPHPNEILIRRYGANKYTPLDLYMANKPRYAQGGTVDDALRMAKQGRFPLHQAIARTGYDDGGPVWDKPRPKKLGKPEPLSKKEKASAKAAAKAAGRKWPNLVDNMRAAKAAGGEIDDALRLAKGGKTPAWQRAAGKNPEGGLNAKGRASAKAEGHDLKPPQPEGGSRRDSFCARMKGMKKKLTSKETANDPNSRINKSLRVWNC